MGWIIGIIIVVFVVGAVSSAAAKTEEAQKKLQFNEMARTRVDAYVDFLRRTSTRPELSGMSDLELKDMIGQKIRAYKTQTSGASAMGGIVFFAGACFGAWQGMVESSWMPFFFWLVIAGAAGLGAVTFFTRKIDEEFKTAGFEPDRLKIEE